MTDQHFNEQSNAKPVKVHGSRTCGPRTSVYQTGEHLEVPGLDIATGLYVDPDMVLQGSCTALFLCPDGSYRAYRWEAKGKNNYLSWYDYSQKIPHTPDYQFIGVVVLINFI
tara:strand:+ start:14980 stop:15315 length:336 start_codon:yes stop_codon:yes gene_type:complete